MFSSLTGKNILWEIIWLCLLSTGITSVLFFMMYGLSSVGFGTCCSNGITISPIVTNLFMEECEPKAPSTSSHRWRHTVHCWEHQSRWFFALLDTLFIPQSDGNLIATAFRKPTHTNQYLSGTATMPCLQNTVWFVHYFPGLKLYVLPHSTYMKNMNIYKKSWQDENIQDGL